MGNNSFPLKVSNSSQLMELAKDGLNFNKLNLNISVDILKYGLFIIFLPENR